MFKYFLIALGIIATALFIQIYLIKHYAALNHGAESEEHVENEPLKKQGFLSKMEQNLRDLGFNCDNYKEKCKGAGTFITDEHDKEVVIEACRENIRKSFSCE